MGINKSKQQQRSLAQLDLNLLKVFKVLIEEKKTITAAKRLNMTQPAVSRALSRLRDFFDDELFVRTRHGLRATEKGELLGERLPAIMNDLSTLFNEFDEFNPTEYKAHFKIAINSFLNISFPARLYLELLTLAPNITLSIETWGPSTLEKLVNNEIDLGINYNLNDFPKELTRKQVAFDVFQILVRQGHPLEGKVVEMTDFERYPMVTAIVPSWNEELSHITKLANQNQVNVASPFRTESISSLLDVTEKTNALFPTSFFIDQKRTQNLNKVALSDNILSKISGSTKEIDVYTHYLNRNSSVFKWLTSTIEDLLKHDSW
ncbi:LysR family transcriptional regulator [Vibrio sp. E150_011]